MKYMRLISTSDRRFSQKFNASQSIINIILDLLLETKQIYCRYSDFVISISCHYRNFYTINLPHFLPTAFYFSANN